MHKQNYEYAKQGGNINGYDTMEKLNAMGKIYKVWEREKRDLDTP